MKGFTLIELMIVIAIIAVIAAIAVPSLMKSQMASNEKSAISSLKHLRDIESIFRSEDSDRNTLNDYWTLDVSGLYRVLNSSGGMVAKIDLPVAIADLSPAAAIANYLGSPVSTIPQTKAGYYFRAMTTDEAGSSYKSNALTDAAQTLACRTDSFGFCATPDTYEQSGKNIYIVSQETTIWKKDMGNISPVLTWPAANPLDAQWGDTD